MALIYDLFGVHNANCLHVSRQKTIFGSKRGNNRFKRKSKVLPRPCLQIWKGRPMRLNLFAPDIDLPH